MRRRPRRVHADVRALPVPGDTAGSGYAHRPGLRARRERLRLQAQEHVLRGLGHRRRPRAALQLGAP